MKSTPDPIRLAITFPGTDVAHGPFPTIDVFPHRLELLEGLTAEDFAIYVAAVCSRMADEKRQGWQFDPFFAYQLCSNTLDAPFGRVRPGAIVMAQDKEISGDLLLTISSKGWHLSDGRSLIPNLYNRLPSYDLKMRRDLKEIQTNADLKDRLLVALIRAALPSPVTEHQNTCKLLGFAFGRIARLVDAGFASGAAGREVATRAMTSRWNRLLDDWYIRPDHIHSPTNLVMDEELDEASRLIEDPALAPLAEAVWAEIRGLDADHLDEVEAPGQGGRIILSKHEELKARHAFKQLDANIEEHAPLAILKPAPKKRQAKLRNI